MLKIVGCFSIIMVFILSFGLIDVSAQTIDVSAISSIDVERILSATSIRDITTVKIGSDTYALVAIAQSSGAGRTGGGFQIINISNPTMPTHIISISDDEGEFDTLAAPKITAVKIGSDTYALVAAANDSGVQIINISNPAIPIAVSSVSDNFIDSGSAFDTLDGANDITTVKIDTSTYALVTSPVDDGVQIINITDPAVPTATSSITDGGVDGNGNTFNELDGATSITTVKIGSDTYALVASFQDDGVQIINITNPAAPTAVSSITDGSTFDELDGARDITTVKIGESLYAIIASLFDDGVQIIDITDPANPSAVSSISDRRIDGNGNVFGELERPRHSTIVRIGDSTYAIVGNDDNRIQIIDISNPAAPTVVTAIVEGGADDNDDFFDTFGKFVNITTVKISDSTYVLVSVGSLTINIIELTEHVDQTIGITGQVDQAITPSQHITGTATISQPDLPTITFNDATVDIALNSEGVGSVAFASLVDGTIVSTENLGSNVIQFILDPDDAILSLRNPNTAGVVNEMPFEIPSFQPGAHTVVYNKTHFTFNFNDPTFTGTTPNVILQANIQSDADTLPAIHEDKANIAFNITTGAPDICESGVVIATIDLDFGTLPLAQASSEGTFVIDNTGNMPNHVDISADYWCDASDAACTDDNNQMVPSTTRFSAASGGYLAKTPFADNFVAGETPPLVDLFTIPAAQAPTTYLQVSIILPVEPDGSPGRFQGAVTQGILLTYSCVDP